MGDRHRAINNSVAPGNDFNEYVNGGWLATATPRAGFSSAGGFLDLHLQSQDQVRQIIEDTAANGNRTGAEQQIGDLYASFMDRDNIEALGLNPIRAQIDAALNVQSLDDVARLMGSPDYPSIVGLYISPDAGDPTRYITWLYQAGLGLPQRSYYLDEDERFAAYRAAYVAYIAATLERAGIDRPQERAEEIMALETALAEVQWEPERVRDRIANYDLKTTQELEDYAPQFAWGPFFDALGLGDQEEFVLRTNTAVQAEAEIFGGTPVDVWASYLAFHLIDGFTDVLPEAYDQASWEFYNHTLNGVEEQRPLEQRGVSFTSGLLGEVIGQVYVDRYFPQSSKDQMDELVDYLLRAYRDRITHLDWMDDATRAEALAKLEAFTPKIGYPDVWRDYSSIEIRANDPIGNAQRISEWSWNDSRSRLGGPIRDWEWGMSPQTVNAYYNSAHNEVVFPAAILQPPFYNPAADMAVNFGAIGGVIGHEIGHGFDDQGSRTDGTGLLRNWWSDASRAAFEERTSELVAQYDSFSPIEGQYVNGENTLGENIGDLGGLSIALHAYHLWLADHGGTDAEIDGFTGDQRVFLGWAQAFREVRTEDGLVRQLQADPHSPDRYRVNGVVRNLDEWYRAFGVGPDDALYLPPEERVTIW